MSGRYLCVAFTGLMMTTGCGGDKSGGPEAENRQRLTELLASLEDLPSRPKEFAASFVSGTPTAARQKYVGNVYYLVGAPTISGDSATAKVAIKRVNTSTWLGETTWEFAKAGDTWKIKSAPMP